MFSKQSCPKRNDSNCQPSQVTDRVTILDYGALKIHNIQKEDAGQYRCVARNSFGLAFSKPVTIEVQGMYFNVACTEKPSFFPVE